MPKHPLSLICLHLLLCSGALFVPLKRIIVDLAIRLPFPLSAYWATTTPLYWLRWSQPAGRWWTDWLSLFNLPQLTILWWWWWWWWCFGYPMIAELSGALSGRWRGRPSDLPIGRHSTRPMFVNTTICYT